MPPIVEDVRNILHDDDKWLELPDIVEVSQVEIAPCVMQKCFGMTRNLAELCASDPCKGLAWWAPDDYVDCRLHIAEAKFADDLVGFSTDYVPRSAMQPAPSPACRCRQSG